MFSFDTTRPASRSRHSIGFPLAHWPLSLVALLFFTGLPLCAQQTLKQLAAPKKVYIGNIISNAHLDDPTNFRGGLADAHLRDEYNAVVLENYMKMSFVLPTSEPADIHDLSVQQLRETLREDRIQVFLEREGWADFRKRGHAMIWFNQAPAWLDLAGPGWTGQQVFDFSRKYITALGQICGDRIDEWDVINEAISDSAPNGQRQWRRDTWYRRANDGSMTDWGEATYENYVKMLFVWAREAQPRARLYINDYGIEAFSASLASKNRFVRDQVKALRACGAPIDGVGFQSHFQLADLVSPAGSLNQGFIDAVEQSIVDLSEADVEVAITELDIRICNDDREEAFQEVAFRAYAEMALSQPNCHEVLIWGLRDEDNWITLSNNPPFNGCQDAVIVEGSNYSPKAAYNGVAAALMALPDQDEFGFAPLVAGNGAPADCGGIGGISPGVFSVKGPAAVSPGDQVTIAVDYLATGDQDVVVWLQLDADPFTVYAQTTTDVGEGSGTLSAVIDVPMSIPPGTYAYRYLAFIAPDGEGVNNSFSEFIQSRVSVLGENSQLIISIQGPEQVSPGDTAEVSIAYSAVEGQEVVVWFQLDQQPFTTFREFRQTAATGRNEGIAKLFIPTDVPIANDAYQFQTLLVPTGGDWPDRISNVAQVDVDVVMVSSVAENKGNTLDFSVFPNPSIGTFTVAVPPSRQDTELTVYSALGKIVRRKTIPSSTNEMNIPVDGIPRGVYWLTVRQGRAHGVVSIWRR